ncbi:MAG: 23S rRNA (uracil(1939)-C(5))-methyltransferase RlmD [Eubacteriales bacterium]
MINKNDVLTITATDLGVDGQGIAKKDGAVFFCNGLLPGETATAKVIKPTKRFFIARALEIEKESPDRVPAPCPVFKRCGGCTLQHLAYPAQTAFKTKRVADALNRIGGLDVTISDCVASPKMYGYRNKAMFPVTQKDGQILIGFFAKGSHDVVDIEACAIQHPAINQALTIVRAWLIDNAISVYDERTHLGLIRQIFARVTSNDALMVGLVSTSKNIPATKKLVDALKAIPTLKSVMVNVNTTKGNTLLGKTTHLLYGDEALIHTVDDLSFSVDLSAFLQVNTEQTENLYRAALDMAAITKDDTVVDLFCGIGTITLLAAKQAKAVYGIEYSKAAIDNANANARANGISNAAFICGDCTEQFAQTAQKAGQVDVLIADPPRKGLDEALIAQILKAVPKRMVYVSCDPGTLARDLKQLAEKYTIKQVVPFDMFPQTTHVETVVLLERDKTKVTK